MKKRYLYDIKYSGRITVLADDESEAIRRAEVELPRECEELEVVDVQPNEEAD